MEEDMSKVSSGTTNVAEETSDSSSSKYLLHRKRPRRETNVCASRFKGVVGQPNGHWGAQIYVSNHRRIWLGTFKSEKEAAKAYDSAAIKIHNGDSCTNLQWTSITAQEPNFQSQFSSTEADLNMIKDGFYQSKSAEYVRVQFRTEGTEVDHSLVPLYSSSGFICSQLFQKELTPSDVGKLNRLVIPKKNALKYFPRINDDAEGNETRGEVEDVQLIFYDRLMRSRKIRYCYWKSSQSFVFTSRWNKFVKKNKQNAKDRVIFYTRQRRGGKYEFCPFSMIDVAYYNRAENNSGMVEEINEDSEALLK